MKKEEEQDIANELLDMLYGTTDDIISSPEIIMVESSPSPIIKKANKNLKVTFIGVDPYSDDGSNSNDDDPYL